MKRVGARASVCVLFGLLLLLPGCHRKPAAQGPQYIMLVFNAGACEQNGSTGIIDLSQDEAVIYQGAADPTQFRVQFVTCPFASCPVDSPHGISVNIGKPSAGTAGTTYMYSALSMSNEPCKNLGQMGVRINPPRE